MGRTYGLEYDCRRVHCSCRWHECGSVHGRRRVRGRWRVDEESAGRRVVGGDGDGVGGVVGGRDEKGRGSLDLVVNLRREGRLGSHRL